MVPVQLVTASGEPMPIVGSMKATVRIGKLRQPEQHEFLVVQNLVSPVILGVDFMQQHGVVLDFSADPVGMHFPSSTTSVSNRHKNPLVFATISSDSQDMDSDDVDMGDECTIPSFIDDGTVILPSCSDPVLMPIVEKYCELFRNCPGRTDVGEHHIPTTGNPVRVPPRRIPAQYREEVEVQIKDMLDKGIIEESSSPWMAPAVYRTKKTGEVRICVDYRALNKQTVKDAYPLPLVDEVQDRLSGCTIFSALDLQSGYWQLPVHPDDYEKTAFCPGPGLGLFQFRCMPFGLTGAPGSFQRLMN